MVDWWLSVQAVDVSWWRWWRCPTPPPQLSTGQSKGRSQIFDLDVSCTMRNGTCYGHRPGLGCGFGLGPASAVQWLPARKPTNGTAAPIVVRRLGLPTCCALPRVCSRYHVFSVFSSSGRRPSSPAPACIRPGSRGRWSSSTSKWADFPKPDHRSRQVHVSKGSPTARLSLTQMPSTLKADRSRHITRKTSLSVPVETTTPL